MSARPRLTNEQLDIVSAPHGSLFVAAAAGVGKTTVLTARFAAMVLGETPHPGAAIDQIATITYTDKAAGEIAERIRSALIEKGHVEDSRQLDRAWISTIHGMCSRILRRHAFDAGIDPRFRVITGAEEGALIGASMDTAVRACVDTDEGCERLLIAVGASSLLKTIGSLYEKLRSMGLSPYDLVVSAPPEPATLTQSASGLLEVEADMATLPSTATIEANRAALTEASGVIAGASANLDGDAAGAALTALAETRLKANGSDSHKALVNAGRALVDAARAELVGTICQDLERALIRMIVAFGDTYAAAKDLLGALDFEDLQLKTVELLEARPEIARRYQTSFQELMIDEFQDTNELQLRVAGLVGGSEIVTVGDDKQSIYRFRNADVQVFRSREKTAPVRKQLQDNWRTHRDVLGVINGLFGSREFFAGDFMRINPARTEDRSFWPAHEDRVRLLVVDPADLTGDQKKRAGADVLARELRRLADLGVEQGDMAVLLRAAKGNAEIYEEALRAHGLRVYVARGAAYFDRPEVADVVALLRTIDNPLDDKALTHVLACPLTGLSDDALHILAQRTREQRCSLWAAIDSTVGQPDSDDASLLARTREVIERLRERRGRLSVSELLHEGCELLEYDITLFASGPAGPRAWANVLKLARVAEEFDTLEPGDVGAFLDHVAMRQEFDEDRQATLVAQDVDAVTLMTIHSSKGLEFGVVAVPDLASEPRKDGADVLIDRDGAPSLAFRLPKSMRPADKSDYGTVRYQAIHKHESEAADEEAKRVFYVACTRAKEALVLCGTAAPAKEATGDCMLSRVRRALGVGGPDATVGGPVVIEDAHVVLDVRLAEAPPAPTCDTHELPSAGALDPIGLPSGHIGAAFVPSRVSYSALRVYDTCPYKYYITHVARLGSGISVGPEPVVTAQAFGTAAHAALQLTMADRLTPERRAGIVATFGLDADGAARLDAAIEAFVGSDVAMEVRGADAIQAECPIAVPVNETLLVGSIDLLARFGDRVVVVDYKTGSGTPRAGVHDDYREQGGCYALAALRDGAASVEVVFVEVERGCATTRFTFSPEDAIDIEAGIASRLTQMRTGEFAPLATYDSSVCPGCPVLGGLCPVTYPGSRADATDRTRR
ncbi:MAG: UvrD-helicase domain-containing protein [Coriobacteriia bacterium]